VTPCIAVIPRFGHQADNVSGADYNCIFGSGGFGGNGSGGGEGFGAGAGGTGAGTGLGFGFGGRLIGIA
jgi:hypothetical protein